MRHIKSISVIHISFVFVYCTVMSSAVFTISTATASLLLINYRPFIMVGLWCYNQSGVTESLIMRDPHYDRMCFKSVKTLGALHS